MRVNQIELQALQLPMAGSRPRRLQPPNRVLRTVDGARRDVYLRALTHEMLRNREAEAGPGTTNTQLSVRVHVGPAAQCLSE